MMRSSAVYLYLLDAMVQLLPVDMLLFPFVTKRVVQFG